MLADERLAGSRGEDAALLCGEPGAGDPLDVGKALRRSSAMSPSTSAGSNCISTRWETRSTSRSGGGGSRSKAAASASPLSPGLPVGIATTQRQFSGSRYRPSSGATPSLAGSPSPLHDEAAKSECPGPDRRSPAPGNRPRQRRGFGRETVELCQGAGHGQPQLGSGAQPAVRRDRPVHQQTSAARAAVVRQKAPGELGRAVGVRVPRP